MAAAFRTVCIAALLVAGCGEFSEAPWILDEPRVLAVRIDVVDEGPLSEGLLPIPVDRVRYEPLPFDTISATPSIADASGLLDPETIELRWLLCTTPGGACLSLLREPGAGEPCGARLPFGSICEVGRGSTIEWTVPAPDPEHALGEQVAFRLVLVAGLSGGMSTDDCIDELRRDPYTSLHDCLLAYAPLHLGPIGALATAAAAAGVDLGGFDVTALDPAYALQPNYHAELVALQLYDPVGQQRWNVPPGGTVQLPAYASIELEDIGDPRDRQIRVVGYEADGQVFFSLDRETIRYGWFVTPPGDLAYGSLSGVGFPVRTGAPGENFQLFGVSSDREGSQSLGVFDIEVVAE